MRSSHRVSLAALVVTAASAFAVAGVVAQPAPPPPNPAQVHEHMQRWLEDRAVRLDSRLAGLKAALKLTPDQEKLWTPFEQAVRDLAALGKAHLEAMMARVEKAASESGGPNAAPPPPPPPMERLDAMATRLTEAGAALKKVADAGKPLVAALSDQQRRAFDLLSRELVMMGHGPRGMGPMMGGARGGPGPMMGPGPHGPRPGMGPPPPPDADDDDDNVE